MVIMGFIYFLCRTEIKILVKSINTWFAGFISIAKEREMLKVFFKFKSRVVN